MGSNKLDFKRGHEVLERAAHGAVRTRRCLEFSGVSLSAVKDKISVILVQPPCQKKLERSFRKLVLAFQSSYRGKLLRHILLDLYVNILYV